MFLGEDVLPGVSFRSAQAEPADLTVGGWVSSVPGGSYDGGLAGQIRLAHSRSCISRRLRSPDAQWLEGTRHLNSSLAGIPPDSISAERR
jgi:hypothetical protein